MYGTYRFYFVGDDLRCSVRRDGETIIYRDDKALSIFKKLNKEDISSIKIKDTTTRSNKDITYMKIKGSGFSATIRDIDKFNDYNLFYELSSHKDRLKKAIDKYLGKKLPVDGKRIRNVVLSTMIAVMIAQGVSGFVINKDTSKELSNSRELATEEMIDIDEVKEDNNISFDDIKFEDKTGTDTFKYVDDKYSDLITEAANKRGVSPNLLRAMVTQESAGEDPNLMQIQFDSWKDMKIKSYNFDKDKYETIVLTDNPDAYDSAITISRDELLNAKTNLSVGAALLQYNAKMYDYNIPLSLQSYNFGPGNLDNVISAMSNDTGMSRDDIISNKNNIDFTNYTDVVSVGDPNYVSNVMRYVDDRDSGINIKKVTDDGIIDNNFYFSTAEKSKSI